MTTLQYLRLDRKLTQPALAKLTGIPQPLLSWIEIGRANPTADELDKLAAVFKVPASVLLRPVQPDLNPDAVVR